MTDHHVETAPESAVVAPDAGRAAGRHARAVLGRHLTSEIRCTLAHFSTHRCAQPTRQQPRGEQSTRQRRGCGVERVEAVRPVVLVGEVRDDDAGRARGERGTRRPRPAVVDDGAHLREQRVVRLVTDADDDAIRLARRTVELDERTHAESPARLGDDVDDAAR